MRIQRKTIKIQLKLLKNNKKTILGGLLFCWLWGLVGCAADPFAKYLKQPNYQVDVVRGGVFLHRVIHRNIIDENDKEDEESGSSGQVLHVYIEGDGRPWRSKHQIALDPTSNHSVVMALLEQDSAPSLYLGRPCYWKTKDSACNPLWWTQARYSEAVVESMGAALNRFSGRYSQLRLIGHSGGGTLAMLIAARRDDVEGVVTLAANLDIDQWADFHGYSRLGQSLSPVDVPLPPHVSQMHFVGLKDKQVPATLVGDAVSQIKRLRAAFVSSDAFSDIASDVSLEKDPAPILFKPLADIDHNCCWSDAWADILQILNYPPYIQPSRIKRAENKKLGNKK